MTLLSIPLHPLFVHAAVCLIPVAAVLAVVFAVKPEWRFLTRWPTAAANLAALVALFVTRSTGEGLMHSLPDGHSALIEKHDQMAGVLTVATVPMVVLALFACWSFPVVSGLASGRGAAAGRMPKAYRIVQVLIVLTAIGALVGTVLAGHSGATAVWTR